MSVTEKGRAPGACGWFGSRRRCRAGLPPGPRSFSKMMVASPWSLGYLRARVGSNHFQRPQLGAARCRVRSTLFVSRLQWMFGKDREPPRVSELLELLLNGPAGIVHGAG